MTATRRPRKVWDPDDLWTLIGPLASQHDAEGDAPTLSPAVAEEVNWRRLRDAVRAALDRDECGEGTGRYRRHHHLVAVCKESGYTRGQTYTIVRKFPPSVEKFGHRSGGIEKAVDDSWAALDLKPDNALTVEEVNDEGGADFVAVTFSDVEERKVRWLWYGRLPQGKIVMVDGDPGVSKSTLALSIAGHITQGREWPDGQRCPEGDVIILSAEDDPDDTMKPRLRLADAKMERVHLLTEIREPDGRVRPPTLADVGPLRRMINHYAAKLVIVDVFMSYVPGKADSHKDQDVRAFLMHIKKLASETGCAFLMLRHLNKSGGSNAKYRGGGSIGITGQARAVWTVGEDPERPDVRVLSVAKVNNAPKPRSLEYELEFDPETEAGRIRWVGESDLSADDLVTEHTAKQAAPRRSEAEANLMGILTDAGGSMPSAELAEAMAAAGFSKATTHRAKVKLGVESRKDPAMDGGWTSYLPNVSSS